MSPVKYIYKHTGYRIRLGMGEVIAECAGGDAMLSVKVNRVKGRDSGYRGRDFTITHRGVTLYSWVWIQGKACWQMVQPTTVWWSVNELETSVPVRERDLEWERMGLAQARDL